MDQLKDRISAFFATFFQNNNFGNVYVKEMNLDSRASFGTVEVGSPDLESLNDASETFAGSNYAEGRVEISDSDSRIESDGYRIRYRMNYNRGFFSSDDYGEDREDGSEFEVGNKKKGFSKCILVLFFIVIVLVCWGWIKPFFTHVV